MHFKGPENWDELFQVEKAILFDPPGIQLHFNASNSDSGLPEDGGVRSLLQSKHQLVLGRVYAFPGAEGKVLDWLGADDFEVIIIKSLLQFVQLQDAFEKVGKLQTIQLADDFAMLPELVLHRVYCGVQWSSLAHVDGGKLEAVGN